ncbi:opacity protein [Sphingomonas aracearum]|uniref:Opacity protein n=1 Tax=Sphingomonas aracearum TaxID=2283317 RepID=A0A369VYN2_9SPHN|nr:opacity protein [Sphingomonas aracearum]RDE07504.1 opacity protein [Sphingomonas aracearum]
MRTLPIMAAAMAALVSVPAMAQDVPADASATTTEQAPDGSKAFGIEPYVGIMGGWESFDSEPSDAGFPRGFRNNELNGSLVEGVVGVNVPLGPVFVGVEGNVAKGLSGDIDWQYGAAGRFGFRAGESGLLYGKVGYGWTNFADNRVISNRDYHEMTYGVGFEVGPKSIGLGGITGESGIRLRGEVQTRGDAHSFRPTLGLVTHF